MAEDLGPVQDTGYSKYKDLNKKVVFTPEEKAQSDESERKYWAGEAQHEQESIKKAGAAEDLGSIEDLGEVPLPKKSPIKKVNTELSFAEKAALWAGEHLPESTKGMGDIGRPISGVALGAAQTSVGIAQLLSGKPVGEQARKEYEKGKAASKRTGFDFAYQVGNIGDPATWLIGPATKAKSVYQAMAATGAGGAVLGFLQPTQDGKPSYYERAINAATGGALGAGFGGLVQKAAEFIGTKFPNISKEEKYQKLVQTLTQQTGADKDVVKKATDMTMKEIDRHRNAAEISHEILSGKGSFHNANGSEKVDKINAALKDPIVKQYYDQGMSNRQQAGGVRPDPINPKEHPLDFKKEPILPDDLALQDNNGYHPNEGIDYIEPTKQPPNYLALQKLPKQKTATDLAEGGSKPFSALNKKAKELQNTLSDESPMQQAMKDAIEAKRASLRSPWAKREVGAANPQLLSSIAGAGIGAMYDKDNPVEGAAIGASAAWALSKGIGRIADTPENINLMKELAEKWKPDFSLAMSPDDVSKGLHWTGTSFQADKSVLLNGFKQAQKEGLTPELDRVFRAASEGEFKLNEDGQALYDKYITPLRKEVNRIRGSVAGAKEVDDTFGTRIALNRRTWIDDVLQGNENQFSGGSLGKQSGAMKGRTVFALDDGSIITQKAKDGKYTYSVWKDGQVVSTHNGGAPLKDGMSTAAGTVKQATQNQIEQHSPIRYLQSDYNTWAIRVAEMRKMEREQNLIKGLLNSPINKEAGIFFRPQDAIHAPKEYVPMPREANIPAMQGVLMPKEYAEVFQDFGKRYSPADGLDIAKNLMVRGLMLNPIKHIANEFEHWRNARGLTGLLTPGGAGVGTSKGLSGLAQTLFPAMEDVIKQGPIQQEILRNGGYLMYPSVKQQGEFEKMLHFGMAEAVKSGSIKDIAKSFGMAPAKLLKDISDGSGAIMWSARDMMYTQLYMEQKQMGKNPQEAIKAIGAHMPEYFIPSKVMGSRRLSQGLQSKVWAFMPYHYGAMKSLGNMVKEMGTKGERIQGADRMLSLLAGMYIVLPYVFDKAVNLMEGTKDKYRLYRAGPQHFIEAGQKSFEQKSLTPAAMSLFITNPGYTDFAELVSNRDQFTGDKIIHEPTAGTDAMRYIAGKVPFLKDIKNIHEGKTTGREAALDEMGIENIAQKKQREATGKRITSRDDQKHIRKLRRLGY